MRKPSKRCKKRDADVHRNDHADDQDKRFFKVLIGDFHERLVIPDKFAIHFRGSIGRSIKLESLGGYTFDVQVAKNLGKTVFQSGWKSFVSAHDLKMLDFLVFKYDGMSRMKVLIFDPSGCEKVPPCSVRKNAINGAKKREEPIDISSNYAGTPKKKPETKKKAWEQRDSSRIAIGSSSFLSNSSGGMASSEEHEAHSAASYMFAPRTRLTSMQERKLKERLRAICSEIPIYVRVMKKSNVSGRYQSMDFSIEYAEAYLRFKERTLIFRYHGKSWEVICRAQVRCGHPDYKRLCKGWPRFTRDNNLQLGDMCLFELLKTSKKYTMNVHIIRKR